MNGFFEDGHDLHNIPPDVHISSENSLATNPNNSNVGEHVHDIPTMSSNNNGNAESNDVTEEVVDRELGRGKRERFPPYWVKDYVVKSTVLGSNPSDASHVSMPSPVSGTPYPLMHYVNCNKFSTLHRNFLGAISSHAEPKNFQEAVKDKGWRDAMDAEMRALEDNGTWTMESLPHGKKALNSKWVYRIKYNSDSTVERLKARLVVCGNHQTEGIDYDETFAPVVKMTTVRTFLAIAASKNWTLHQMDVDNVFLHGDLDEEVYMRLPPGFTPTTTGHVCRLRKSLYGLKQAPLCWFAKLVHALTNYGFVQSRCDYSLFTYYRNDIRITILAYVDDLVIAANDDSALSIVKDYLRSCFPIKDLGVLKYFLGFEVAQNADGIVICQRKYALDIISEVGYLGSKPVVTPIEQNHSLGLNTSALMRDPESYRRLVGRLLYLVHTRPDLTYVVHILSQYLHAPRIDHLRAALRVVRYLKGSPGQGIFLSSSCNLELSGWSDSDYAACPLTPRSLTGWMIFRGGSPISWKSKKQAIVSRSSTEAEYRAMTLVTCEIKWLKGLLLDLSVSHTQTVPLHCDNASALHIAQNPVFHERTKHIEVDCHFIRDAIIDGIITTKHVSTTVQLADLFTKALGGAQFRELLGKMGITDLHAPS
ncbi:hypothetical protein vseg_015256 [Gypsophila vaccaria]